LEATYILPLKRNQLDDFDELTNYLHWLAEQVEVIVVDGSPPDIFALHHARWNRFVMHIPPDPDVQVKNGKVRGVLTGLRRATHERIVIADEDVRYDALSLKRIVDALEQAHVVRPQNYFDQLPWHALWDTGRTLLNRMTGGDWPGTLGVRLSVLQATNGYDGDVLFENLELVRTIRAAGGKELIALDLFVRRRSPHGQHFWSQRVRQAYDEFARPVRLIVSLALLPCALMLMVRRQWLSLLVAITTIIGVAELGRRRGGGQRVFPFAASLLAPVWLVERAICIWLAAGMRLFFGGVPYHGTILTRAANSERVLRKRFAALTISNIAPPTSRTRNIEVGEDR
jgi:hypothetical protein